MKQSLVGLLLVVAGCGTQVDLTTKAYEICGRTGYHSEDDVNRLFVTTEIARDAGATEVECATAMLEGCSTWDYPHVCANCGYAVIAAVFAD